MTTDSEDPKKTEPKKPETKKEKVPVKKTEPAPITPIDHTLQLMQIAVSRGATPDEMKALMDMRRELQAEYAMRKFREDKAAFLSTVPMIKKRKTVFFRTSAGTTSYAYAPLEDIVETIKPYLERFGFSYSWAEKVEHLPPVQINNKSVPQAMVSVKCILSHKDGHSEECFMQGMLDSSGGKNPIQMLASSSTYLRRYTLTGVTGIATADEDIDGRIQTEVTGSATLEGILSEGEEEADVLSDELVASSTLEELNIAGAKIKDMPEGTSKERLKKEYYAARKLLEEEADNVE